MMASLFGLLFTIATTVDYNPSTMVWYEEPVVIVSAVWIFAVWGGAIVLFKRPGGGSRKKGASEAFRSEMRGEIAALKKDMADVHDRLRAHDNRLRETRPAAAPWTNRQPVCLAPKPPRGIDIQPPRPAKPCLST